jgi:hypothetical protein
VSERITKCPGHTQQAFDIYTMPQVVRWIEQRVIDLRADAIVATGHSGLPVAGAVSFMTRIPLFAVRKAGEPMIATGSGQVSAVAPNGPAKRWVWVDDLVSGGTTLRNPMVELDKAGLVESPYPEALLLYNTYADGAFDWDSYKLQGGEYLRPDETFGAPAVYERNREPRLTIPYFGRLT